MKMSAKKYTTLLKGRGLSIVGAAPVLGISRRHSQRLASGEAEVPQTVAKLLTAIEKFNIDPKDLE